MIVTLLPPYGTKLTECIIRNSTHFNNWDILNKTNVSAES